ASLTMLLRGGALTSGTIQGLEAERAQALVTEVLGHPAETTFVAVMASDRDPESREHRAAVAQALAPLRADLRVLSVVTPESSPPFLAAGLESRRAHASLALITLRGGVAEAIAAYPAVRAAIRPGTLTVTATGHVPFVSDMNRTLAHDLLR